MHIAFVTQYFYPEQFSNNSIASWLSSEGHDVDVFSCVPNYPGGTFFEGYSNRQRREEEWQGVHIHRTRTVARGESSIRLALNFLTYPIAAAFTMRRALKGQKPDVSFVSMPSPLTQALAGLWLRFRKGTPCVYWVQDIWPESLLVTLGLKSPLVVKPLMALCGWIYRRADLVLVQSEAFPPMIERFGVPREKIRVLPNTAPELYRPMEPNLNGDVAQLIPKTGRLKLMFAGNIGASQGFDTYLEAADLLEKRGVEVDWLIVGSGRDQARVEGEIARRGLAHAFHFLGRHPEGEMPEFFAHADALLVSLKDTPIFRLTVPYKVQCYMACGKPIICSLSGEGARVIEEANCGFVSPASEPEGLAGAIEEFAALSDEKRVELGRNANAYYQRNYSAEVVYGTLTKALRDAANQGSSER